MTKVILACVFCMCSLMTFSASAMQGMYLRLDTRIPSTELTVYQSDCISNIKSIQPNETIYIEAINSGICFFKGSKASFNLYINGRFIQKYDIHVSANGSSISPDVLLSRDGYQITAQLYPNSGIGTQDSVLFHVQKNAETWQGNAKQEIANIPVNQILMPGSHDSGTYGISENSFLTADAPSEYLNFLSQIGFHSYIQGWAKTQRFTILDQLSLGTRYFDLRICGTDINGKPTDQRDNVYICHTLSSVKYKEIIDEVNEFLKRPGHEKELILLDINHLYNISDDQMNDITDYLQKTLGDKIASSTEFLPISTYAEFWKLNKQIIVFMNNDEAVNKFNNIYWAKNTISSPWPNAQDADTLVQKMEENLRNRNANEFFVLQTQQTPDIDSILSSFNIFKSEPKTLLQMTGSYQLEISDWFFTKTADLWANGNIIIQDFIGGLL